MSPLKTSANTFECTVFQKNINAEIDWSYRNIPFKSSYSVVICLTTTKYQVQMAFQASSTKYLNNT